MSASRTPRTAIAVRHVPFEDLGILAPLLAARSYETTLLDAGIDTIDPDAVAGTDLLLVLGGPIGVYDEDRYPFLHSSKAALATRLATGGATLGVCLGAQLLAEALGAEVRPTGAVEIGYGPLALTPEGRESVLAPLDGEPVLHWHGDEFAIPAGAHSLAHTPGFPIRRSPSRARSDSSSTWKPTTAPSSAGSSVTRTSSITTASTRGRSGSRRSGTARGSRPSPSVC